MARGSIQRVSGGYRIRVELARDPATGKRRWHSETLPTKRAADARVSVLLREMHEGSYRAPSRETLGAFLTQSWLPWYRTRVRGATFLQREIHVRRHIVPALGHARLGALTTADIDRFYVRLLDRYKPNSVRAIHTTLTTALGQAVRWGHLKASPAAGCSPPGRVKRPTTIWSAAQLAVFFASLRPVDGTLRAVVATVAFTGMRRGEALALTWSDVDLDKGVIRIERTITRTDKAKWIIGPPKSAQGRRRLPVAAELIAELRAHKTRQDADKEVILNWPAEDWVFTDYRGRMVSPMTLHEQWKSAVGRAGLPMVRMHDLRHAAATRMLEAGIPLKVVSEYLGHANISITADTYQHVTEETARRAGEALGGILGQPESE
jgi:integrase